MQSIMNKQNIDKVPHMPKFPTGIYSVCEHVRMQLRVVLII